MQNFRVSWPQNTKFSVDLDLMISESVYADLEKEDLDLPLWDLTTSLGLLYTFGVL